MKYRAILFDLDGTLLPLDQDHFIEVYFGRLAAWMTRRGYEPKEYINAVTKSTGAMMKNDGSRTNEEAFWEAYTAILGEDARGDEPILEEFYRTDFGKVQDVTGRDPVAIETVHRLKELGVPVILATNPVFPPIATESRLRWAGFEPEDFNFISTYSNIGWCKPSAGYYMDIMNRLGLVPEDCLMVGNDVDDDMSSAELGFDVFLLTDNLLNRHGVDVSGYPQGGFADLQKFLGI